MDRKLDQNQCFLDAGVTMEYIPFASFKGHEVIAVEPKL